ncbi:hypothetical protein [Actinomadura sp. CNU-125]|uniref:hypothetical protein n=1 Tax=Actinomadura sp. CNU-125 TaxID=1904961 RepID=UPI001177C75E|nr:hypothetical protein [Actinomadura sp. CNU-125]
MSAAPLVLALGYSLFGGPSVKVGMGIIPTGQCQGWMRQTDLWSVPGYTLLQGRPWAIVLPAFLVWLLVKRRAVGWTTVALLTPLLLAEPALFAYDVARWGRTCVELWYTFGAGEVFWQVYDLLPLALVLAATYRPGPVVVRTAAALAVTVPLFAAAGDRGAPVPLSSPEACKDAANLFRRDDDISARSVENMPERERKLAYLCAMRDYNSLYPGSPPRRAFPDQPSDAILLDDGRRACDGERRTRIRPARQPSLQVYVYLCPKVAAAQQAEMQRAQAKATAESERVEAKIEAFCERKVPDADVRPVREYTRVLWGGLMRAYSVGELAEGSPYDEGVPDELVVADGGAALVTTDTEDRVCLTVRAYRREPPPALGGWDHVVEVGFDSPDGKTTIEQIDSPPGFPAVTAAGDGHYRLRLHVSGRDEADSWPYPAERHLLVVFPGRSEKTEVLK